MRSYLYQEDDDNALRTDRKAGETLADTLIEMSARILKYESDLNSEIWHRKADAEEIDRLKGQVATAKEREQKAALGEAEARVDRSKHYTLAKEAESQLTKLREERLTDRGRIVDLQAELAEVRAQRLKADEEARKAYARMSDTEGHLSIARADLERLRGAILKEQAAYAHVHDLYIKEMKLKEKARRELRKLKRERLKSATYRMAE